MNSYLLIYYSSKAKVVAMRFNSLKDVQVWLQNNRNSYSYNLGNTTVYQIEAILDPYEIIQGNYKE